ncbi:hypothetical protein SAMN02990966_07822 [Rhodospirillales bacterium URHD0017]|nr:hypothetical protein SAMN02990966_07822 [Rhodospirillales bacterium URHD0017]
MNEPKSNEPVVALDDKPPQHEASLEERRKQAHEDAKGKLAGKLPSGYADAVIRCDDEPGKKPPEITPTMAASMAKALVDLTERAGLARADVAEVKNVVAEPKPPGNESEADAKKKDEDKDPTLADVVKLLGTVSDRLDNTGKRLDAMEKRGDVLSAQNEDKPEDLAADDANAWKTRRAAERADNVLCDFRKRTSSPSSSLAVMRSRPASGRRPPARCRERH